jgi:hypothetical protein
MINKLMTKGNCRIVQDVGLGKSDSRRALLMSNNHYKHGLSVCSAGHRDFDFLSQRLQTPEHSELNGQESATLKSIYLFITQIPLAPRISF